MTSFGEVRNPVGGGLVPLIPSLQTSDIQAEKRGNFIVIGCVEGSHVVSWSLNVSRLSLIQKCLSLTPARTLAGAE
jgi:hypothetical protein